MSPTRTWRALAAAAFSLVALAAAPAAAQAAQRLESFAMPSTQGNVDPTKVTLNRITSLRASVLLPDGYDENPGKAYPVLYLLQGVGDNSEGWTAYGIAQLAAGFPGIVVMTEGGRGFYSDWWQGGARSGPRWTRYHLDEVFPTIEQRYRILPGRQNHAIGGLSMGGYGAMFIGGQLPGYFGTIVSMSGLLDTQSPENLLAVPEGVKQPYEALWGPITGPYATAHNPMRMIGNVAASRVYLSTGNGVPDVTVPFNQNAWTTGVAIEARVLASTLQYGALAAASGANTTIRLRGGVHDWPYWRRELPKALAWNVFGRPPVVSSADALRWRYKTMEPAGNAWGIGYRFAQPTVDLVTFVRDGQTLTGTGTGTVTINPGAADADATGAGTRPDCSFTTTLPFERTLPAGC